MTANAVLNPCLQPLHTANRHRCNRDGADDSRKLRVVEPCAEEVAKFFYGMLFSLAPTTVTCSR